MKKNHYLIPCILFNTFTLLLSESATHPLFQAAREGKRDVIREHLNNNANCAIKDNNGNTILHIAAEHGHAEIIEDLTQYRGWWQYYISGPTLPLIDEHNNNGYTPLETSINSGQYDAMIALMEAKKDKQKTEQEQLEAFIAATRKNDPSSIYLLEQFGYNPLIQSTEGSILHHAIQLNKKQVIGYCARKAALINTKNKDHKAPIVLSVEKEDENEIDFLAYVGADVNISGKNGMRPLHSAKTPYIVDCLLRNKALIDAQDYDGHTPLHYNTSLGNEEMVKHLLARKADVKKRNNQGEATFAIATRYGKSNVTRIIAEHPDSDINEQDINGQTAYIKAAKEKNLAKMEELIGYNVNRTLSDKLQENALHKLAHNGFIDGARLAITDNPALLTAINKDGDVPLFTAIQHKQTAIAQLYSAHNNAPLHIQNNNGDTVLHEAARTKNSVLVAEYLTKNAPVLRNKHNKLFYHYCAELGDLETIKEMKRLNIQLNEAAPGKKSMLHLVLENNHMHCAPELMYSYMINYKDSDGIVPLALAARHGSIQTIKDLLCNGADINAKDNNRSTAMHYAAYYGQHDAMEILKANGLSPLVCDINGDTSTHIAAQRGNLATIDYCIQYNWQTLAVPNNNNETPFITSARHGQERVAKKLLNDTHFMNNDIDKAIEIARRHGNHATARMLENEKQQCIDECKKIAQSTLELKNLITKNKNFKSTLAQKRPREYIPYVASMVEDKTWEQLYRMPTLERTAISISNSQALMQETVKHTDLNKKICAIEVEESRLKLERITAETKAAALELAAQRKQEAERVAIEQQRIRVAQLKEDQRKQEEQRAREQAQALQNNPPVVPAQNNAPVNDAVEEKAENDNAQDAVNPIECCICLEEKPVVAIPCGGSHSDSICSDCLAKIKHDKNICPLCRAPLV